MTDPAKNDALYRAPSGTLYHPGEMHPTDCELCTCESFLWGTVQVLWTDPPTACRCGHPAFRHRWKPAPSPTHRVTPSGDAS